MGTLLTAQFFCKPKSFLKNGAILTFFLKKRVKSIVSLS